jgi:myo-inositol-1(or 4)-monophosphatase
MIDLAAMLDLALTAARAGATVIEAATQEATALEVRAKRPNDFVTQVDTASEAAIVRTLLATCPQHAVRTEESAALHGDPSSDALWIVDPLDGTNNFIHGYPRYAVSVALALEGVVEVGVVIDVARGTVYSAVRGGGASCDGVPLAVSARASLADAMVASTCPLPRGEGFAPALELFGRVLERASALRRGGSAALDLAFVAAGRLDAMFDRGLAPWDVAAGALMVQEAGGVVSTYDGGAGYLEDRECLAANPALHAELRRILGAATG